MLTKSLFAIVGLLLILPGGVSAQGDKNDERPVEAVRAKVRSPKIRRVKSPRDVSTGQSSVRKQTSPGVLKTQKPKVASLGDTGTHEVGHVENTARKTSGYIGETEKNLKNKTPVTRAQDRMGDFEIQSVRTNRTTVVANRPAGASQKGYRDGWNGYKTKQPRKGRKAARQ